MIYLLSAVIVGALIAVVVVACFRFYRRLFEDGG